MNRVCIRKATECDLEAVEKIYDKIHDAEESGKQTTGWIRGVYPVRRTAEDAAGKGYGRAFVNFYETHAKETGCTELRMDTNERNAAARALYHKPDMRKSGLYRPHLTDCQVFIWYCLKSVLYRSWMQI